MNHIFLDHCWVCGVRFTTANPPGLANEQKHHIIPTAFGGADGPQVSLCDGHHSKLHRIAEQIPKKPYSSFLQGESPEVIKKLMFLATKVVNARELAKDDPNKHTLMTLMLDPKTRKQLDQLKPVLNTRSREAVIRYAIASLHNRSFTKS